MIRRATAVSIIFLQFTFQVGDGRIEGEASDGQERFVLRAKRVVD